MHAGIGPNFAVVESDMAELSPVLPPDTAEHLDKRSPMPSGGAGGTSLECRLRFKVLDELAAGAVGTSNRRHSFR